MVFQEKNLRTNILPSWFRVIAQVLHISLIRTYCCKHTAAMTLTAITKGQRHWRRRGRHTEGYNITNFYEFLPLISSIKSEAKSNRTWASKPAWIVQNWNSLAKVLSSRQRHALKKIWRCFQVLLVHYWNRFITVEEANTRSRTQDSFNCICYFNKKTIYLYPF